MVRRYMLFLSVTLSMLLAISGCSEPAIDEVTLDTEFTLSVGQSVSVAGEGLQLTFVEVVSDSRCPSGATCIWAGEASCLIELTTPESTYPKVLTQPGSSSPPEASVADYEIVFDIQPYPELGKDIQEKDYLLKLVVTRAPA